MNFNDFLRILKLKIPGDYIERNGIEVVMKSTSQSFGAVEIVANTVTTIFKEKEKKFFIKNQAQSTVSCVISCRALSFLWLEVRKKLGLFYESFYNAYIIYYKSNK